MATKDERPTLFSKVAMFVRNPTKDWAELDRIEPDQESGYDKQALKAMIERKRQNDFVRKREFDQLRKLRNRGGDALGAMARPSVFQSSMATDPDGRAVTLKKIDEIEAQMSKQWWKGKQDAAGAAKAAGFPVAAKRADPDEAQPSVPSDPLSEPPTLGFERTIQADAFSSPDPYDDFEATALGGAMEAAPHPARASAETAQRRPAMSAAAMGALAQSYDGSEVGFSTSKLFAIEVDELATDPELEEAAIRFANGDDAGAEKGLLEALRGDGIEPAAGLSWVAALLDLYRATNKPDPFAAAVNDFGFYFDNVVPVWAAIGDGAPSVKAVANKHTPVVVASGALWDSPADLTAQAMENLRDVLSSNPPAWHLDWSQLVAIAPDAMPLLGGLFESLCAEEVGLQFSGADQLVQALRAMMPSGDRSTSKDWWNLRLNALRVMQLQDEFELAALDFCVTFEVAPPAWEAARCLYASISLPEPAVVAIAARGAVSGPGALSTAPMDLDGGSVIALELKGQVVGDATQALAGLEAVGRGGSRIVVSCVGLVRVDFSAAGSILNWVATRQAEGCMVQFRDVHRLVAAFFNVIGINEHARVVPRQI
jgi:hypothetical protein